MQSHNKKNSLSEQEKQGEHTTGGIFLHYLPHIKVLPPWWNSENEFEEFFMLFSWRLVLKFCDLELKSTHFNVGTKLFFFQSSPNFQPTALPFIFNGIMAATI